MRSRSDDFQSVLNLLIETAVGKFVVMSSRMLKSLGH